MKTIDVLIGELQRQASSEAPSLLLRMDPTGTAVLVGGQLDVAALAEAVERQLLVPKLQLPMRTVRFKE